MPTTEPMSYGLLAVFDDVPSVYRAAEQVRDAGYRNWDVLSPFPIHGIESAMGEPRSKVPYFTFAGGLIGFLSGMGMAAYMGWLDYPLIVGGQPYFDFVFPFPVAYELTILLASFGTLIGMFVMNRLPMHYHPVFNHPEFKQFTNDRFAIVIESRDPGFDDEKTRELLELLGGKEITEIAD